MMRVTCGFTIPITKYGLPPSVENIKKVMGEISEAGFDNMEMEIVAGEYADYEANWDSIIARSKETNVEVVSIMAVTYDIFSLEKAKSEKAIEDFDKICEMTAAIGAKMITNCFYLPPEMVPADRVSYYNGGPSISVKVPENFSWTELRNYVISQLKKSSEIATKHGLKFALEMRAGDFISSIDGIIALFKDSGLENIGMVYDVAHAHAISEYLDLGIYKLGDYLKLVHLSDNDGSRPYHYEPGKGNIDFKNIIDTLKKVGYNGNVVIDISGIDNIMDEAVKMKAMVEKLIAD